MGLPPFARLLVRRDLVEEPLVVAQRDQLARDVLEAVPPLGARARERDRDARLRRLRTRPHGLAHSSDLGVVAGEASLAQLLAQLEDLHEQRRGRRDASRPRASVIARDLDAAELEQILGALERLLQRAPRLVE